MPVAVAVPQATAHCGGSSWCAPYDTFRGIMLRTTTTLTLSLTLIIGSVGCDARGGQRNQRDAKLDEQQQRINQAVHHMEAQVDQAVQQAKQAYGDAFRSAQQAKSELNTRIEKVDQVTHSMVDQARKVEQMANAGVDKAQSMVGAVQTVWSNFQPGAVTTPSASK